ncbi:hypothetical protein SALBM217S_04196 [Streptomyces griseoloalbus]
MAEGAFVFAMANRLKVHPEVAHKYAAVVATGRSDFPNQINNVLAFPGIFAARSRCGVADHQRDWRNEDNVQLNNDLIHDVNATTAAFWQAEITCHNKITALVGGSTSILEDGAEKRLLKKGTTTYGFTADMLNQSQELPWGSTVEKERHGLDWLGHQLLEFGKGFVVDGVWGTIRGLGTLVGVDGRDAAARPGRARQAGHRPGHHRGTGRRHRVLDDARGQAAVLSARFP